MTDNAVIYCQGLPGSVDEIGTNANVIAYNGLGHYSKLGNVFPAILQDK